MVKMSVAPHASKCGHFGNSLLSIFLEFTDEPILPLIFVYYDCFVQSFSGMSVALFKLESRAKAEYKWDPFLIHPEEGGSE